MIVVVGNGLQIVNLMKMKLMAYCAGTNEPIVQVALDIRSHSIVIAKLASGAFLAFNTRHREKKLSSGSGKKGLNVPSTEIAVGL